jgi:hypothetical protein
MLLDIFHGEGQVHDPVRVLVKSLLNALAEIGPLYQSADQGLPDPFPLAQVFLLLLPNLGLAQIPHCGSHIRLLLNFKKDESVQTR